MQRRVLIKRWRDDTPYFSDAQETLPATGEGRDGRIRIAGVVSDEDRSPENLQVHLRVVDPPDQALYIPVASRVRGDNADGAGTLAQTTVTTDAAGRFETVLRITGRAAGDNYEIEASTVPSFGGKQACDPTNNCYKGGVLTAWKRMYVEKRRMLRNGMFLSSAANAGDTSIVVRNNRYGGNRPHDRLSRGDTIVLVHAPQLDRSDEASGWYMERHTILDVTRVAGSDDYIVDLGTRQGKNITRETLLYGYRPDRIDPRIGDAISRIDGAALRAVDVFDAQNDLVTGSVFPAAFTEYLYLPDATTPGAGVPVPHIASDGQLLVQRLVDKWSSVVVWNGGNGVAAPNHQLLVIGDAIDTTSTANATGLTISEVAGETSSLVFRGTIDEQSGRRGVNADVWARKTSVHEIAHQWRTNTVWDPYDHCPATSTAFDDPNVYCLLAEYDPARSDTQRANGIAKFHMLPTATGTHSEYLEIRRRADPFTP